MRRTGIKADLVRAWERRYEAVVPERTPTDRRLYTEADIQRLCLLRDATRRGHRIGHIASLTDAELKNLLIPESSYVSDPSTLKLQAKGDSRIDEALNAIEVMDARYLTIILNRASFDLGRIALIEDFLGPLMNEVGERWKRGELDPAQEHMATATLRNFVSGFLNMAVSQSAPSMVVTTPAGQLHELGSILAAALAAAEGWRVTYLGPNLPATSIAEAVRRSRATVVALGISCTDNPQAILAEITTIKGLLQDKHLMVGGSGRVVIEPFAEDLGIHVVANLAGFRQAIARLS